MRFTDCSNENMSFMQHYIAKNVKSMEKRTEKKHELQRMAYWKT